MLKVCKFGGTSMATVASIKDIEKILKLDDTRRFVIVSAPGKRFKDDDKVTDLLYACQKKEVETKDADDIFIKIKNRYLELAAGLGVNMDEELSWVEDGINPSCTPDYAASRGEYLSAILLAKYLKVDFVDATKLIFFNEDGSYNEEKSEKEIENALKNIKFAVIPGFYGVKPNGQIKTFSRGGSDITGAIIASGIKAHVYENWTDVNGFMIADPRIIKNPCNIEVLSYKELRELSYMGASVLHAESVFPVKNKNIPINIRNTFEPTHKGTLIVNKASGNESKYLITGIAGKKGFISFTIEKSMLNNEVGFARRVLSIFEKFNISVEHTPSGIDTYSIIVAESEIKNNLEEIKDAITKAILPDHMEVNNNLALIATVGHGMSYKVGTATRLFKALSDNNINIRMIDQGSSELNIIVGVDEMDYEKAIKSIYNEFVGD